MRASHAHRAGDVSGGTAVVDCAAPNRWRLVMLRNDGTAGVSFTFRALDVVERVSAALRGSFVVESYRVEP